jgi:hypothetical protein
VYVLSSSTVLETRAQFADSHLSAPAGDDTGPAVTIAGVASFGTSSSSPTARRNTMTQVVSNLSHQRGAHALRLGVDFLHNDDVITFPRAVRGSYAFSSLVALLSGVYNNAGFTQTFGETEVAQQNPNVGLYVRTSGRPFRVTLNAGLRYDLQFLETIATDRSNLSPRIGVAISPFAARHRHSRQCRPVLRPRSAASGGQLAAVCRQHRGTRQTAPGRSNPLAGADGCTAFPQVLAAPVPTITLPNLTTMDRDLQSAYSRQAGVEVEHQIDDLATISAGYEYVRGLHLLAAVNQNVPTCVPSGTNNGCRPNPNFANNSQYSSVGDSTYHGLHVTWVQGPTAWCHYRVSYTLSKAMNNVGEFFFSNPIDPTDLSKDWDARTTTAATVWL